MEVVKANMFIIPNNFKRFGDLIMKDTIQDRLSALDLKVKDNSILVQVWVTNKESNNWADHKDPIWGEYFTSYLPLNIIGNLKEGDSVKLKYHGVDIELTAKQQGYRYQSFGNFEDVIERLSAGLKEVA